MLCDCEGAWILPQRVALAEEEKEIVCPTAPHGHADYASTALLPVPKLRDREPSRPRCTLSTHTHMHPALSLRDPCAQKELSIVNVLKRKRRNRLHFTSYTPKRRRLFSRGPSSPSSDAFSHGVRLPIVRRQVPAEAAALRGDDKRVTPP